MHDSVPHLIHSPAQVPDHRPDVRGHDGCHVMRSVSSRYVLWRRFWCSTHGCNQQRTRTHARAQHTTQTKMQTKGRGAGRGCPTCSGCLCWAVLLPLAPAGVLRCCVATLTRFTPHDPPGPPALRRATRWGRERWTGRRRHARARDQRRQHVTNPPPKISPGIEPVTRARGVSARGPLPARAISELSTKDFWALFRMSSWGHCARCSLRARAAARSRQAVEARPPLQTDLFAMWVEKMASRAHKVCACCFRK